MYSYGSPHTAAQKQDDQHERTFSSYVRIQVVVLKTYLGRWTIGRSGERGSGISVLPARYDDDDDDRLFNDTWTHSCLQFEWFSVSLLDIGLIVWVVGNRQGDLGSIPGRVIPKTQKMVLDITLLSTQHYKVEIKGKVEKSRERSNVRSYTLVL